mmetsp:Transcript_44818/g.118624  ORF Transcript_44818/g.118624 Transcript_44818/m.118624 type:complete len:236 (+) Transcript_44818:632-1339(+)
MTLVVHDEIEFAPVPVTPPGQLPRWAPVKHRLVDVAANACGLVPVLLDHVRCSVQQQDDNDACQADEEGVDHMRQLDGNHLIRFEVVVHAPSAGQLQAPTHGHSYDFENEWAVLPYRIFASSWRSVDEDHSPEEQDKEEEGEEGHFLDVSQIVMLVAVEVWQLPDGELTNELIQEVRQDENDGFVLTFLDLLNRHLRRAVVLGRWSSRYSPLQGVCHNGILFVAMEEVFLPDFPG